MNYTEFLEKYKPIKNTFVDEAPFGDCMFETYGEDIEFVKQQDAKHICTIIDEDDSLFILPGFHVVNRYGYLVTRLLNTKRYAEDFTKKQIT